MIKKQIRVGIIGTGSWARYGHIPALQSSEDFDVIALAGRTINKVAKFATQFGIPQAYDSPEALLENPDVDLVVVLAPTPEHGRLTKLAIFAGKDVYCEWPLSTTSAESEEMLTLAQEKGVKHIIGLQRGFSPSSRYWYDLIRQGYVGQIRSVHMSVGVDAFGQDTPQFARWVIDEKNFTNLLSIYGGHFSNLLFRGVGFPQTIKAIAKNHFPFTTITETGEAVTAARADEIMFIGSLAGNALFSVQLEGGQKLQTGLQIDITGTEGVLRITNCRGFQNVSDNTILSMRGDKEEFVPLPVPDIYRSLSLSALDASVQDVAYLYSAYASDKFSGSHTAPTFEDAVRLHTLIDSIASSCRDIDM